MIRNIGVGFVRGLDPACVQPVDHPLLRDLRIVPENQQITACDLICGQARSRKRCAGAFAPCMMDAVFHLLLLAVGDPLQLLRIPVGNRAIKRRGVVRRRQDRQPIKLHTAVGACRPALRVDADDRVMGKIIGIRIRRTV